MSRFRHFWGYPVRLLAYWLLFFAVFRLWFVLRFFDKWPVDAPVSAWYSFWYALPLDLSMCGYLLLIPLLLWNFSWGRSVRVQNRLRRIADLLNALFIFISIAIFGGNIFLYSEWSTMLNHRAFEYLKTPGALFDSLSVLFTLGLVLLYGAAFWIAFFLYQKIVRSRDFHIPESAWYLLSVPVQLSMLVLGIRGGLSVMAINESAVYYSTELFNNHAATNPGWHFIHTLLEQKEPRTFRFMAPQEAQKRVEDLFKCPGAAESAPWLMRKDSSPPNIVFVIMESMTAQVIAGLDGAPDLCPNLNRMVMEGLSFRNCYSSGYRTDQGLVAILAGFPSQPDRSIILEGDKAAQLPSLSRILLDKGYQTQFFYGGGLTFANMGAWLKVQGFQHLWSENDFPGKMPRQRWGVDDRSTLKFVGEKLNSARQPFFTCVLTLSLHPPFDVPYDSRHNGLTDREKFMNSAAFVDSAIGEFMESVKTSAWYANTLFVFVADHGASLPGGYGHDQAEARRVPLLLYGPLIAPEYRGRMVETAGNHHDIPGMLLPALGYREKLSWSRNLLPARPEDCPVFAYYTNEDGVGWVTRDGVGFYAFSGKQWRNQRGQISESDRRNGEAYLEYLFETLNRN